MSDANAALLPTSPIPKPLPDPASLVFFLGGHDLEMTTIRELLQEHASGGWYDRGLSWGAKASAYASDLEAALMGGRVPVLVELDLDLALPSGRYLVVNHHDDQAVGKPTALEQVYVLLRLPASGWSRWYNLVAANDRGHIRAMLALEPSATVEEIRTVRAADRAAQGMTPAEEMESAVAAAEARVLAGGSLTVLELPHERASAAVDWLEPALGGRGHENVFAYSPHSVNFFGERRVIEALRARFPGGHSGGASPDFGYWCHESARPGVEEVEALMRPNPVVGN